MGALLKFLLLALALVWLWHSPALRGMRKGQAQAPKAPQPSTPDTMVACNHCGLHVPQTEAFHNGHQQPFCSPAHRDLHP